MIDSTRKKLAEKEGLTGILRELFPYLGLLLMIVLFSVTTNGKFLRIRNLTMILKQSVIVMIGALGSSFVLAHGNMDFSIGGEMALCCLLSYYVSRLNPYLMLPACILLALLLSFLVGVVHVVIGVPAFVSRTSPGTSCSSNPAGWTPRKCTFRAFPPVFPRMCSLPCCAPWRGWNMRK